MRPVRLLLDGFGCYRSPADADFSDVDFFALVGPTGSGKSTVIDGLCFALYGTVPRWGKENVIAQALAPAANSCRVCLVFEVAGKRYAAVRALTRDKRGVVHTKEARLDRLDAAVEATAPLEEILAATVESLADGPDQVKEQVQNILGLTYEHFTQSVLLPQGRFSEFLHAKPADRQGLLVELLAFGIYEQVGQAARQRATQAAERARLAEQARTELSDITPAAAAAAEERVRQLTELAATVEQQLSLLIELRAETEKAVAQAQAVRAEAVLLATARVPADIPGLAQRIADASQLVADRTASRDSAEQAETAAQEARAALPDKVRLEKQEIAYAEHRELSDRLNQHRQALAQHRTDQEWLGLAMNSADLSLREAQEGLAAAERSHAAAALAAQLRVGEQCPVCLHPVTSLPHHPAAADLQQARAAVDEAEKVVRQARSAHDEAARTVAVATRDVDQTVQQLENCSARLADAPSEPEIAAALSAIGLADATVNAAQTSARAARQALQAAEKQRLALGEEELAAWRRLSDARDSVVQLGAPAVTVGDLAGAWDELLTWAKAQRLERALRQPELDKAADLLKADVAGAESGIRGALAEHNIDGAEPARAEAAIAAHRERAENMLAGLRANLQKAAELDEQIGQHRQDAQVAAELGRLLRANTFERWLCGEALDSLVAEASYTLMELSGGQYQLDRDDRNDLFVIDYQDAGARRPVHTLSGGETFQASLALALALSRQVVGLSAGLRDLNSMFLDEGFGTLDEDTLETVGTTLERLSFESDRMIGIVTHVQALAERAPTRFVVSRAGTTATLRKEVGA